MEKDLTPNGREITHQTQKPYSAVNDKVPDTAHGHAEKRLTKDYLINKLNFINFQNDTILINFKNEMYDRSLTLHANPEPCLGPNLDCTSPSTSKFCPIASALTSGL